MQNSMMSSYKQHLDLNGFDDVADELSDDEVFTQGGKTIPLEENGLSKPLMAPRQKARGENFQTRVRKVPPLRIIWAPTLYGILALGSVIGIIGLVVFLINIFMNNINSNEKLFHFGNQKRYLPCDNMTVDDVWIQTFPMLTTETAIRLNDVNLDGIDDIILGFGTGADAFYYPPVVCDVYFNGSKGCGGGIMALEGSTGKELWRQYSAHEIFAINCNIDIDDDNVKDCIGGGRMAGLMAVSGKDGKLIWIFDDPQAKIETSNVYTPQYIRDLDLDGLPDLLIIHGGDPLKEPGSATRLVGRIMILSARNGKVIRWMEVPDKRESYYSPQIIVHPDGTEIVLFGTGGETHGGSLWYIALSDILKGHINKAKVIYNDPYKGIMTPPVLVDLTQDGVPDIVMAMFNSTVIAYNGYSFEKLWNFRLPSSESYSTPGVGFYNNDSIPDFIINYQVGPGFPIYYYTQVTVLDGKDGKSLLEKPVKMVVGTQTSPLAISVEGFGNDIFLYWISDCHGEDSKLNLEFDFIKGTSVHDQSRADFCKLRFEEKLFTKMYAMTSHLGPPGLTVYDSDKMKHVEFSNQRNYSAIGEMFLQDHPEYWHKYSPNFQNQLYKDDLSSILQNKNFEYPLNRPQYNIDLDRLYQGEGRNPQLEEYEEEMNQYKPDYNYNPYGNYRNIPSDDNSYYKTWHNHYPPRNSWMNENRSIRNKRKNVGKDKVSQFKKDASRNFKHKETIKKKKKRKRHVGPHDGGGIQRSISTGTLAPALNTFDGHSIDMIFATFWFYPSHTQVLLPEDKACIERRLANEVERFRTKSTYYGLDHDAYEEEITKECLKKTGHYNAKSDNAHSYNPFNRPMGQMTVYRMRISCNCDNNKFEKEEECPRILPLEQQGWISYMGRYGNCNFNPRSFK